jgi:hypothetical protein
MKQDGSVGSAGPISPPVTPSRSSSEIMTGLKLREEKKHMVPSLTGKRVLFPDQLEQVLVGSSVPMPNSVPGKSILKSQLPPSPVQTSTRHTILKDIYSNSIDFSACVDLDEILEVACMELQRNERESHLTIYASLNAALRAKDRSISTHKLLDNGNLLAKYARRDLNVAEGSKNTLDVRIVVQILRLVDYLFFSEDIAMTLDHELVRWFLLRGLGVLECKESSKSVTAAYLHIFNYQRLPKTLPNDMALRLLCAVVGRPTFSSAGMISEYICTYRLLLQSNPAVMLNNVDRWVPHVVRSLVDSNSLIRQQALSVAQDCNQKLLGDRTIGKCVFDTFNSAVESEDAEESGDLPAEMQRLPAPSVYFDIFNSRLSALITTQGEGKAAMAIWVSVMLLLLSWGQNPEERIDRWQHIGKMLELCKTGFNSPYLSTKVATINSWTTPIHIWTSPGFWISAKPEHLRRNFNFLLHPFRLLHDSRPAIVRALSSTLNGLLYASTRQQSAHLDVVWEQLVVPVVRQYLGSNMESTQTQGVLILRHLLSTPSVSGAGVVSKKNRILSSEPVGLLEVTPFSPKWVRGHAGVVLVFFEEVFAKISWPEKLELWQSFLKTCRMAVRREIHTSSETMELVAGTCNFVQNLTDDLPHIYMLVQSAMDNIGMFAFSDKSLLGGISGGNPLTVSPSFKGGARRISSRYNLTDEANSPIFHLWKMLTSHPETDREILNKFLDFVCARISVVSKKLALLQTCLMCVTDSQPWCSIAQELVSILEKPTEIDCHEVILHIASWPRWVVFGLFCFCFFATLTTVPLNPFPSPGQMTGQYW